jgi:hypothetical protein
MKVDIIKSVVIGTLLVFLIPIANAQNVSDVSDANQVQIDETVVDYECVADYSCVYCGGTAGTWYIVNYPWFSQYTCRITKNQRKLVWGTMSSPVRNPPEEGATTVTRNTSETVSISWSKTTSGSATYTIKSALKIPGKGSIGGSFTASASWSNTNSGSSSATVSISRDCLPGYAIWERGYYYSREVVGTRYQYNDGLRAVYACSSCGADDDDDEFELENITDIYGEQNATFVYPSGEAGIFTLTGPYNTDIEDENHYNNITTLYNDVNLAPKSYKSGKGGTNW